MIENWNSEIGRNFRIRRDSHDHDHESDHIDLETHINHNIEQDDHEEDHENDHEDDHENDHGYNQLDELDHEDHDHDYDHYHDHDETLVDPDDHDHDHDHDDDKFWTTADAYGYATLANGIITITSVSGIMFISCIKEGLAFCDKIISLTVI